jgi:hypothetical protein
MTTFTSPPATSAPDRRSGQPLPRPRPADAGTEYTQVRGGARLHRWKTRKDRNASRTRSSPAGPRRYRPDADADQDRVADTFRTALTLHVMR